MEKRKENSQSSGTYASEANAANDSLRFRPKRIGGTRDIVTIECLRPDDVDACNYNIKKNSLNLFTLQGKALNIYYVQFT